MAFLSEAALHACGFERLGRSVKISDKVSIYNPAAVSIGDYTRIDDFCVISPGDGGLAIGRNVHIAVMCSFQGQARIAIEDFVNISSRVAIYSSSDDFTGKSMTNPTIPDKFKNVRHGNVTLRKHALIGAGAVILPGVEIGEGTAIGALSLVNNGCEPFSIFAGIPAKKIKAREREFLALERQYLQEYDG